MTPSSGSHASFQGARRSARTVSARPRVSRPADSTPGLSQNRACASPLTRLPSGKRAGHTDPPVHKEVRVFSGEPLEKAARAALRSCKALELPHHPVPKRKIDVSEQGIQSRWCVSSVLFNPTPSEGIDPA